MPNMARCMDLSNFDKMAGHLGHIPDSQILLPGWGGFRTYQKKSKDEQPKTIKVLIAHKKNKAFDNKFIYIYIYYIKYNTVIKT